MYEESHFVNNDVGVVLLQYFSPNASNFYGHSYYRYKKSYGDKAKGFTEKIQENDVGVELKGKYLGKDVRLCVYNSNITKTVYLIDIFFKKGYFMDLYEQYLDFREKFNGIYGKPTEILDESFEETLEFGKLPMCATYYESSKGLISLEISEDKHCVEISFQDKRNAEIMRKEKPQK